jgi:hypothetical protein
MSKATDQLLKDVLEEQRTISADNIDDAVRAALNDIGEQIFLEGDPSNSFGDFLGGVLKGALEGFVLSGFNPAGGLAGALGGALSGIDGYGTDTGIGAGVGLPPGSQGPPVPAPPGLPPIPGFDPPSPTPPVTMDTTSRPTDDPGLLERFKQFLDAAGIVFDVFQGDWPSAVRRLYDAFLQSLPATSPGNGSGNLPVPAPPQTQAPFLPGNDFTAVSSRLMKPVFFPAESRICYKIPSGYVQVKGQDGVIYAVRKDIARDFGLYKPRARAPISAGEWKQLKTASRVMRKAHRIHEKAESLECKPRRRRR